MNKRGLTAEEVKKQIQEGNVNVVPDQSDKSVKQIIMGNIFTYFNLIFFVIAVLVIFAGSYKNLLFLPVVAANIALGIFQQMKAKKVLDQLSLLDKTQYTVVRDGEEKVCASDELVLGDLVFVGAGQQIPADGYVADGAAEVNESLLTGEADEIEKTNGAQLKSGSFVVSGNCYMTLTGVGEASYAAGLMRQAKKTMDKKSEMVRDIEMIVKIAGILVVPIGVLMFVQSVINGNSASTAIISMVAAVIGMIPEGMYLLTTVALALSAMRLAKRSVLLHDMRSIETLARVDVLCVDKTGTITEADMSVKELFPAAGFDGERLSQMQVILSQYIQTIGDSNATMEALRRHFIGSERLEAVSVQAFSSKTKYSAVKTAEAEYRLGAPEMLLSAEQLEANRIRIEERTWKGQRVLLFARIENGVCLPFLFISLENEIRRNAEEIFSHFAARGVTVKVISGDNPLTVSKVAQKAGIVDAERYIDASGLATEADIAEAVEQYTVFGRVKPEQKKQLVAALRQEGLRVAMTGDGVNDILAMKEADCSIAMGVGSDAARQAAQVVLMDSDFSHLKEIVSEGCRDIHNITRSSTLFLYKNLFSMLLAAFSIINSFDYPLLPSQISLVSMFNIGIPSFFLALEANEKNPKGRFLTETLICALPAALTSFLSIALLVVFANLFELQDTDIGTASTYLLSVVGFIILFQLSVPLNKYRAIVLSLCVLGFLLCLTCFYSLFSIEDLSMRCAVLCAVFALAEVTVMRWLTRLIDYVRRYWERTTGNDLV